MQNKSALSFLSSTAVIVTAVICLLFPVFFLTITTDFFTFPKQILIVFGALLLLLLWGIKIVLERKITLLMSPLNLPVLLFGAVLILSTFFSLSRQDALLQSVPVILLCVFFFTTVNFLHEKASFTIVITSLLIGSAVSALLSILASINIFVLPFASTKSTAFNTHGSPVQYAAFLLPLLVLCAASLFHIAKKGKLKSITKDYSSVLQVIAGVIFVIGVGVVLFQIFSSPQKPILLPFSHGFQIAFAAISQDSQRLAQSLLVGSGYGTFSTDFTRFVSPAFNGYTFWNLTFAFSSSYVLELLATTGVLGLFAFAFIFVNFVRSRTHNLTHPLFLSTLTIFILSLLVPFSFSLVFLLFVLLSLFVAHRAIENAKGFDTITLNLVALKQGLISLTEEHNKKEKEGLILPTIVLVLIIIACAYVLFSLTGSNGAPRKGYVALIDSDIKFAKSFSPEALRSGKDTYNLETQAIAEYPYRSDYYRLFSQINLALAANIVTAQQGKKPSQEVQDNIVSLLQQSINSARQAVTLSPLTAINWQNLGQIYRNLIGVGQNAEQFAIASYNQATTLNPSNPGLRIELGGIYYQLQQWDLAQNQFTIATQLKSDYANAYYNLGHVLEQKGDLKNALAEYQTVAQLVANDKPNLDRINTEIKALQDKIGQEAAKTATETKEPTTDTTPLNVNQPQQTFPEKDPKAKIAPPPQGIVSPTVTPTTSATPPPSQAITPTQ
jgi:tetratricopeptide (TPR) repeat protein